MKRAGLFGLVMMSAAALLAQVAKPVRFTEETFDFGSIKEEDGPVAHTFSFTNASNRPVTILSVKPSCGCTTPEWSKEPVLPGKSGIVKAQYDPKGRPGYFHKSLTITTDYDGQPVTIYIKGQVTSHNPATSYEYSASSGTLRFRSLSFNLGKVFRKDEFTQRNIDFVNGGDKPVTYLDKLDAPSHIRVEVIPKTVQPGQRGEIKIGYNGMKKGQYGFQRDKIVLHTDDSVYPLKEFAVYATLEDYFIPPTPEALANAPQLRLAEMTVELGNIKSGQPSTREIAFSNTGKSDLEIREVQGNCSCLVASANKQLLKPGESAVLKLVFTPEDRKGTQTKAITVYSNDLQNPVQRIMVGAYAE
ncbi:DUF1573 domain-containing protein [Oscillatoria amoena NRMC-F 0135]|nr:DUF1573 domain-containing protein [Oscillatoria amoena NRMC-F 0135]